MKLPNTIKTIEELPEEIREAAKQFYVEDKDVGFKLDVDGVEDPAELRRAKQRESERAKAAEAKLKEIEDARKTAEEAARKAAEEAAKKSGDVAALDKSWQEKHTAALAELEGKFKPLVDKQQSQINRLLIENVATGIASAIAVPGSADVLLPHIRQRLRVAERDGELTTVVVDQQGQASAATLAELTKEFQANKAFAPLIVGSKASGGGANGGRGSGASDNKTITRAEFEGLGPAEKAAHFKQGGKVVDSITTT